MPGDRGGRIYLGQRGWHRETTCHSLGTSKRDLWLTAAVFFEKYVRSEPEHNLFFKTPIF